MGFVNDNIVGQIVSNNNCCKDLAISFTKLGREYLSGVNKGDRINGITVKYFSLGDSDNDYNNTHILKFGFIPNVTGEDSNGLCLNGNYRDVSNPISNIYHFGKDLITIKSYKVSFLFDKINSSYDAGTNDIFYILEKNGGSIFSNNIKLEQLIGLGLSFLTENDAINYFTSIKSNYIKPEFNNTNILTLNPTITPVTIGNSTTYVVTDFFIEIKNLAGSDTVNDNSVVLSTTGNINLTNVIFNKQSIPNPNIIPTFDYTKKFQIPSCSGGSNEPSCADYYDILALTSDVSIATIFDCIISDFDGWF
jgi:hypothetical protein